MSEFRLLLFRELKEKLLRLKNSKRQQVFGMAFNLVLLAVLFFVVIFVFRYFLETYLKIRIGYADNTAERRLEALTFVFALGGLVTVGSGIFRINKSLTSSKIDVLLVLPVKKQTVFLSKFVALFVEEIVTCLVTVLPLGIVFSLTAGTGGSFWAFFLAGAVVLTFFSVGAAALLALPFHYLGKLLGKNYVLLAVVVTALVGFAFLAYSQILNFLKQLLETGQIKFVFSESVMRGIGKTTSLLFPSNILAELSLGANWADGLLAVGVLAGGLLVSYLAIRFLFGLVSDNKLFHFKNYQRVTPVRAPKKPLSALLRREFLGVLRVPAHSFQYFSTALLLPLMVYVTATLMNSLVQELIYIDCSFEVSVLCIAMFSILTNTFCASGFSREGKSISAIRLLPVSGKLIVWSKVLFSGIVSELSILFSVALLGALGLLGVWQAFVCFAITSCLSLGMICLATKRDLSHPDFEGGADSSTVTFLVFWGLVVSLAAGAAALFCSMYFRAKYDSGAGTAISIGILGALSAAVFALSALGLGRNIDNKLGGMEP